MLKQIVYISSDMRSGSTMLDIMLGNHSLITSLGEVNHIQAYANKNRKLYNPTFPLECMCGMPFEICPFWNEVQNHLNTPFSRLKTRVLFDYGNGTLNAFNKIATKCTHAIRDYIPSIVNNESAFKFLGYEKNSLNRILLYEAAAKAAKTPIVVDSSKHPVRFKSLYFCKPEMLKIILLYRDPKAVVYSKMKRGQSLKQAASFWNRRSMLMELYSQSIPSNQLILIKYENICSRTVSEMERLCDFLNIAYEDSMACLDKNQKHLLGGSPSKNDASDIMVKQRNEADINLKKEQINEIYRITKKYAQKLGYI